MDLTTLYCSVDDFWKSFKQEWDKHLVDNGKVKRGPEPELAIPEMMTILIYFINQTLGLSNIFIIILAAI